MRVLAAARNVTATARGAVRRFCWKASRAAKIWRAIRLWAFRAAPRFAPKTAMRGLCEYSHSDFSETKIALEEGRDPLHLVQELMARYRFVEVPELPRFCGGAVGFLGYDLVRFFEKLPDAPPDDRDLDDCHLLLTDTLLIFDNVRHTIVDPQ